MSILLECLSPSLSLPPSHHLSHNFQSQKHFKWIYLLLKLFQRCHRVSCCSTLGVFMIIFRRWNLFKSYLLCCCLHFTFPCHSSSFAHFFFLLSFLLDEIQNVFLFVKCLAFLHWKVLHDDEVRPSPTDIMTNVMVDSILKRYKSEKRKNKQLRLTLAFSSLLFLLLFFNLFSLVTAVLKDEKEKKRWWKTEEKLTSHSCHFTPNATFFFFSIRSNLIIIVSCCSRHTQSVRQTSHWVDDDVCVRNMCETQYAMRSNLFLLINISCYNVEWFYDSLTVNSFFSLSLFRKTNTINHSGKIIIASTLFELISYVRSRSATFCNLSQSEHVNHS